MNDEIPKRKLQKLIQKFHDKIVLTKEYQDLIQEYTEAAALGVSSDLVLERMFDYLDVECKKMLKEYLDRRKNNES